MHLLNVDAETAVILELCWMGAVRHWAPHAHPIFELLLMLLAMFVELLSSLKHLSGNAARIVTTTCSRRKGLLVLQFDVIFECFHACNPR